MKHPSPIRRVGFVRIGIAIAAMTMTRCNDLELPEPPDVVDRERAYETPTAPLTIATAEAFVNGFVDQRVRIAELGDLRIFVDALLEFERDVMVAPEHDPNAVYIGELPIRTDAVVEVLGDCPGWPEDESPVEAFAFTIVVRESTLLPTAWGPIDDCRFVVPVGGSELRLRIGGELVAYMPNLLSEDDPRVVIFLAFEFNPVEVDGTPRPRQAGELRWVDDRLELLVGLDDVGTIVASAGTSGEVIVRAANGGYSCLPSERRCEPLSSSSSAFTY